MDHDARPLLIFDGDCGFCTASASWIERGWRVGARSVPWQALGADGLSELGLTAEHAQEAAWWVDESGRLSRGHRALGHALMASRGWRGVAGSLLLTPPVAWLAACVYPLVVRFRYRLPGATPACRSAEERQPSSVRRDFDPPTPRAGSAQRGGQLGAGEAD
jgi:predicted DCC family thiol-disulfide oxidoreductase YuxK